MNGNPDSTAPLEAPGPRTALIVSVALTLALVTVDVLTGRHDAVSVAYAIPIVLAGWTLSQRWVAAISGLLMFFDLALGYLDQPAGAPAIDLHTAISATRLLIIAGVVHVWVRMLRELDRNRTSLERQNTELENMNDELRHREQETVRQSEELQSQTEELERQGEELRLTNEELSNRERMLEQLLELSRSLTAELEPADVHRKICEALALLMEGQATAITERRGNDLVLLCHHGFGEAGPEQERLPYAHSFSALIMSLGQSGYLEDVELRKDLAIPQPKSGPRFRAVLATPLRLHGKCVGTIETYSPAVHSWSQAQITMIESLAAQASISLQSGDLIETIRQERRRFESVFRTVPFGLCVADNADGTLVRFNPAGASMFGVAAGEHLTPGTTAAQRVLRAVLSAEEASDEELPLNKALRGEESYGREYELRLPDNRRVTLLTSAAPIHDGKGAIVGAVCGFADITAQKALMRELELRRREAEEAAVRKTRFLASVSHDIRTPANAINLMAEVIKRTASTPEFASQIPALAGKLQANALSLVELVSDVLDLARYDTGKIELQESEFSLSEVLNAEVVQLLPLAQEKGIGLTIEPLAPPVWLRTDAVKLGRVLGNLIGNAIKFTDSGTVTVAAGLAENRSVWIRVTDTGIGMPAHELPRIFDEFAQLRNPERDRSKGTGMGLAICHRLVTVLGGTIAVSSEPGRGTTFSVNLPASTVIARWLEGPRARARAARSSPSGSLQGLRVLLVEDHATTREGTARILVSEGAQVIEAADAASALAALGAESSHVLLLDMMLPDRDGREILKAVREKRPPPLRAVFVLTGDLTHERLEEVRHLGADGLIGKPISVSQLVDTLAAFNRPTPN